MDLRVSKAMRDVTITDKDFFTSRLFVSFLRSLLSVPCRVIDRIVPQISVIYSEDNKMLACTDDKKIFLNVGHPFFKQCRSRAAKAKACIGAVLHEFGHYRFTDAAGHQTAIARLRGKKLLHFKLPRTKVRDEIEANKEAFDVYLNEHGELIEVVVSLWHDIYNILEDAYIEECLYRTQSGMLIDGLEYLRRIQKSSAPPLSSMLDSIEKDRVHTLLPVIRSLLLCYAKYGVINCNYKSEVEMSSEPMMWLNKIRPFADELLMEPSTAKRLAGVHNVFLLLWPVIEEYLSTIDVTEADSDSIMKGLGGYSGSMGSDPSSVIKVKGKGTPVDEGEETGESGSKTARERTDREMGKAKHRAKRSEKSKSGDEEHDDSDAASDKSRDKSADKSKGDDEKDPEDTPKGDDEKGPEDTPKGDDEKDSEGDGSGKEDAETTDEADDSDTTDGSGEEEKDDSDASKKAATESEDGELDRAEDGEPAHTDDDFLDAGEVEAFDDGGEFEYDDQEEEALSDKELSDTITSIERDIREDAAMDVVNRELSRELDEEAAALDYGAAHRRLKTKVERINRVSDDTKTRSQGVIAKAKAIADIMVRKVLPLIRKESDLEKMAMGGFFSGARFDAARLVYGDYRYFRQGVTPAPDTRLAVSIVVDESGSMGGDRIQAARTAALILHLFCQGAGVKCSVIGHTSKFGVGDLQLSVYADYETPDADDVYRLLSIRAKEDNRDGAAIFYAGERLLKREEPFKMMIVISDGAPCATGYHGVAAENDMSNIVGELRRQGVTVFAAAIGSDKENIQRIFGDGFLDITNLAELPDQLCDLVRRNIR